MLERMTSEAKRIIERSLSEAMQLGYPEIRTEHLLLAMLRETDSVTATVLGRFPSLKQDIFAELAKEAREKRLTELRSRQQDPLAELRDEIRGLRAEIVEFLREKK